MSDAKIRAAQKALDYIKPKINSKSILGIGTGSTVNCFIELLKSCPALVKGVVSSSDASTRLLRDIGIDVFNLNDIDEVEFYIDGADEIADDLSLIKGGGGAHTQEKIIATASKNFLCIADQSKIVSKLGSFPIPVEVLSQARSFVARKLTTMGGTPKLRHDFITDQGNEILDLSGITIDDPISLETKINSIPGVIDNGIFGLRKADKIFIG
tara:strand:+ start:1261 stop:1896 length:636 start_codon:yes stop_codon:yes gene_type:complete